MAHSHHEHCCDAGHEPAHHTPKTPVPAKQTQAWREQSSLLAALAILLIMLVLRYGFGISFNQVTEFIIFSIAWLLSGYDVVKLAFRKISHGDFFNEFVLMTVATLGAFAIGEYSEGVAVMVFYSIGEWFQSVAVNRAKSSIRTLMDSRPDEVTIVRDEQSVKVAAADVGLKEVIELSPGEKLGLDGSLLTERASFNTAALTGESKPQTLHKGEAVYAGMLNLNTVSHVEVNALYRDSKLSKVLEMVQDAAARKSKTQLFISKLAKIYTPVVFFLAAAVCIFPYFFTNDYRFSEWFYRSLVFLVISCPCALLVSIPLGYFGGIGLASRHGILFKGGNFLDVMAAVNTVIFDKTGTLTKGVFKVTEVLPEGMSEAELTGYAAAIERYSTHPAATAIVEYALNQTSALPANNVEEIAGFGVKGMVNDRIVLAGSLKLLEKSGIAYPPGLHDKPGSLVALAVNGSYAGCFVLDDELKADAVLAITALRNKGIDSLILSGDRQEAVDGVAAALEVNKAYGGLLPEDKINELKGLMGTGKKVAFVGDGLNDAPVIALADAGIAMGGLGSDAAIETADIVIQNDMPSRVGAAIHIARLTRIIVWQNIVLAILVKVLVLILGAGGHASLWEAVIADVGVALLAILNAFRLQQKKV